MAAPITYYVNALIALAGSSAPQASFTTPLFLNANAHGGSENLQGPFTSLNDVTSYGFVSGSPFYDWASAVLSQQPRPTQFYSGRLVGGDVSASLDAIEAEGGPAWYLTDSEARDQADLEDLADWTEPRRKIAVAQSTLAGGAVGASFFASQYTRTALIYHPDDDEHLAGAWASRCLGFNLDVQKGEWSYKSLNGVPGTDLTTAEVAALRAVNANYYSPIVSSAGVVSQAYTSPGRMPSGAANLGRRISTTTTLDWLQARVEEAGLSTFTRETHGLGFEDTDINRFAGNFSRVLQKGVRAKHLTRFVVPDGEPYEGTYTPAVFAPRAADTTPTEREAGDLGISAIGYLRASIERVVINVGLSL